MSTRLSAEELDAIESEYAWPGRVPGLVAEIRASWADLDAAKERTDLSALASVTQLTNELDAARAESVRLRAELDEVKQDRSEVYREAASAMNEHNERALALGIAERESVRLREALRGLVRGIDGSAMELPEIITGWVDEAKIALAELESETP